MTNVTDQVRQRFELLRHVMDERVTRLWAAAEARSLGRGGVAIVTAATGIQGKRIWHGQRDLDQIQAVPPEQKPQEQRIRRPGAGRKPLTQTDPTLLSDLDSLVDPVTRGDPESPLRWTCKSKAKLAEELETMGHAISATKVGRLLHDLGYSLQSTRKTIEGKQHSDRNAQFKYINSKAKSFLRRGQPVISVDTKKKELVGDFKNAGREWQPQGEPEKVQVHDFIGDGLGKAIPYGVYDLAENVGSVSVGIDHDTAEFAVQSIRNWWRTMGSKTYPEAMEVLITADAGGSNSYRNRLWKTSLQKFADETGLSICVSHFPPGTSKWNKIEHRLFSHISQNWRGRPLTTFEAIVSLIGGTKTTTGLRVKAKLDRRRYPLGKKVTNAVLSTVRLRPARFHGEWNYRIQPH
jgi:Rhodopirellula transposase DDE domain